MALTKAHSRMIEGAAINVKDYGAVGDGVTDDTAAIKAAIASGSAVYFPEGKYRITSRIDADVTSSDLLHLIGCTSAYLTHFGDNAQGFNQDISSKIGGLSTIIADGCSVIGDLDDANFQYCEQRTVKIQNLFFWGQNGAPLGIHIAPIDCIIEDCTFAFFNDFGLLIRNGITSNFKNLGFCANGYGRAPSGSGTAYPATYQSGCNLKIVGGTNVIGQYYTTGTSLATTYTFENIYCTATTAYSSASYSGFRSLQVSGLRGGTFINVGGYQSAFFDRAFQTSLIGCWFESYSESGFAAGDGAPFSIYVNSAPLTIIKSYIVSFAAGATRIGETFSGWNGVNNLGITEISDGGIVDIPAIKQRLNVTYDSVDDMADNGTAPTNTGNDSWLGARFSVRPQLNDAPPASNKQTGIALIGYHSSNNASGAVITGESRAGSAGDLAVWLTDGFSNMAKFFLLSKLGTWIKTNFLPESDQTYVLGTNTNRWGNVYSKQMTLIDGVTAPSTLPGHAIIYVDAADGDLKIKFGDGTVKTIVTDS